MSRSEGASLLSLAERRELNFANRLTLRTPMLVPSFSSRVPKVEKIFRASEAFIEGPFLISAYDVKHGYISPPYNFGSAIFLDSGGYEISSDKDLSDVGDENDNDPSWSQSDHVSVLSEWNPGVPSVIISYDHPKLRHSIAEQIDCAKKLSLSREDMAREILIKPETSDQRFIKIDSLIENARDLAGFDVIGVTEKEIGNSVWDRMLHIAKLRIALDKVGLNTPIHVFGSLDTITTLFYFVAGADIFDGLTWLRYAFKDGHTLYRQDFGINVFGIGTASPKIEAQCWANNHNYMNEMELTEMKRFLKDHDFKVFKHYASPLQSAYENVREELGV